jgi:hypothetical protein
MNNVRYAEWMREFGDLSLLCLNNKQAPRKLRFLQRMDLASEKLMMNRPSKWRWAFLYLSIDLLIYISIYLSSSLSLSQSDDTLSPSILSDLRIGGWRAAQRKLKKPFSSRGHTTTADPPHGFTQPHCDSSPATWLHSPDRKWIPQGCQLSGTDLRGTHGLRDGL